MSVTIFHNPACGTSRNTLALIRHAGIAPVIVDELGLDDPQWTDDQLLAFIQQHPILMNRPVVRTPLGAKLCRPGSEAVLELLPVGLLPPFTKEDGEVIRDTGGRRAPAA